MSIQEEWECPNIWNYTQGTKLKKLAPIWSSGSQNPRLKTMLLLTKSIVSRVIGGQKHVAKGCDGHSYVCLTSTINFQRKCGHELKQI